MATRERQARWFGTGHGVMRPAPGSSAGLDRRARQRRARPEAVASRSRKGTQPVCWTLRRDRSPGFTATCTVPAITAGLGSGPGRGHAQAAQRTAPRWRSTRERRDVRPSRAVPYQGANTAKARAAFERYLSLSRRPRRRAFREYLAALTIKEVTLMATSPTSLTALEWRALESTPAIRDVPLRALFAGIRARKSGFGRGRRLYSTTRRPDHGETISLLVNSRDRVGAPEAGIDAMFRATIYKKNHVPEGAGRAALARARPERFDRVTARRGPGSTRCSTADRLQRLGSGRSWTGSRGLRIRTS